MQGEASSLVHRVKEGETTAVYAPIGRQFVLVFKATKQDVRWSMTLLFTDPRRRGTPQLFTHQWAAICSCLLGHQARCEMKHYTLVHRAKEEVKIAAFYAPTGLQPVLAFKATSKM
eukprot:1160092-Pelagomonas_calceolata.AAC.7